MTGPDGALWFTESKGAIGRITTSGQVTQYPVPDSESAGPDQITVGPDGASGILTHLQGLIGRITTSGQVTTYAEIAGNPKGS